jgi:peptide/nickel transport system permease protein
MGDLVIAEATLSFLGIGLPPTVASWGAMVAEGQRVMLDGWWLAVLPGLAIAWLVISLALIGDGLQELGEPG